MNSWELTAVFSPEKLQTEIAVFLYSYLRLYVDINIQLHHFSVVFAKPSLTITIAQGSE